MAAGDQDRGRQELWFRELYQANFRPVQGYTVNRLGAADDVPDVVAEDFTIAWRRLADVPPPPRPLLALRHGPVGDRAAVPQRRAAAQPARPPRGRALSHAAATGRGGRSCHRASARGAGQTQGHRPGGAAPCALGTAQLRRGRPGARLLGERRGDRGAKAKARLRALLGEETGGGRRHRHQAAEPPMDLDTMLTEAAPARHLPLDGPDSPAAVRLYQQITTQLSPGQPPRHRYAVPPSLPRPRPWWPLPWRWLWRPALRLATAAARAA